MSVTSYTKSRIDALLAGAVGLAGTTPLANIVNGFAGTANLVSRSDHQHPLEPGKPPILWTPGAGGGIGFLAPPGSNSSSSLNRANFGPIWITSISRGPIVPTALGVFVSTAASAGGTIRIGVWRPKADGSLDFANKLVESGEISSTSTGYKSVAYTTPIPEGLYWVGVVMHTATCSIQTAVHGMVLQSPFNPEASNTVSYLDSITGAFPTTGGTNIGGDIAPNLFYTAA